MQQVNPNPSAQAGKTGQNMNIEEEKKKLEEDLKQRKITQAEYYKRLQELGVSPNPQPQQGAGSTQKPAQLPPAQPGPGGIKPVSPITPITPISPQQAGPKEEIPPIGQALAISSEDVEVVECYKCGGLITVTTPQRPVIIACPTCGTKGEVDSEELETPEDSIHKTPKASEGVEIDDKKIFKFGEEDKTTHGPQFGASLHEDLAKQEKLDSDKKLGTKPMSAPTPAKAPTPKPAEEDKDK